jgi:glycine oxidase
VSDVVVIGGGVIGCAVAYELSRRGAGVTLVEPRAIGAGASQASAGMLAPFHEGRHDPLLQKLGIASLDVYEEWASTLGADRIGYRREGSVEIAFDEGDQRQLRDLAAALDADDVEHAWLDPAALRIVEPDVASLALGALVIPSHGVADVPALTRTLWERAANSGARRIDAAAERVSGTGGSVRVETRTGSVAATHVVLAAGSWAGLVDVAGAPRLPVRPVRGQLVVLDCGRRISARALWGPRAYAVPRPDGSLLIGATVEEAGFDEQPTAGGVQSLLAAAIEMLPATASAVLAAIRVGLRPGTPDDRPIIGRSPIVEGLIYATGHYRNGALLAPLTGVLVSDLVEGRDVAALAPLAPERFGEARPTELTLEN